MNLDTQRPLTVNEFFEGLTWERFRDRLAETLKDPHKSVPTTIACPAVMTLFRDMAQSLGETAIQKKGEPLTIENIFSLDQRLALVRILETLVRMAEAGPVSGSGAKGIHHTSQKIVDRIQLPPSPLAKAAEEAKTHPNIRGGTEILNWREQLKSGDNENT